MTGWGSRRCGSPSSSELANASESGVERRAFSLSSRTVWLVGATAGRTPWPGLDGGPGLTVPELIVYVTKTRMRTEPAELPFFLFFSLSPI